MLLAPQIQSLWHNEEPEGVCLKQFHKSESVVLVDCVPVHTIRIWKDELVKDPNWIL